MQNNHITAMLLLIGILLSAVACTSETAYSTQLKKEKKLIADYIKRNNITIIHEEPAYNQWKPNEYLEVEDYCYFNLTQMGDTTTDSLEIGDNVAMRYRKYTLGTASDTISYWTTLDASSPIEFQYGTTTGNTCTGWYYALKCMKYTGAQGKLICPSKLGFTEDGTSVTPYGYDLKFRIRTF